mmetsp:Transcript_32114/g.102289  ORF Transcript_32114/g.102289 Transcript_32114/m.102289 type:complete len:203 (-) Transcript_32114:259-867(-)
MPWDQTSMNGSSLDPYTRTLAYVADLVTKARASLPTSASGRMVMLAVLLFIGSIVFFIALMTSFLWAPFSIFGFSVYFGVFSFRIVSKRSAQLLRHARHQISHSYHILLHQCVRMKAYALEPWKRQDRQAAIRDRGFLRNIFEALPEVDADGALQRVCPLEFCSSLYSLLLSSMPHSLHGAHSNIAHVYSFKPPSELSAAFF